MGIFSIEINNSTHPSSPWKGGKSYWSSFELFPDWKGSQLDVFKGVAHHAREYWTQTTVVAKAMRRTNAKESDWDTYIHACNEARNMAAIFNRSLRDRGSKIRISFAKPVEAKMDSISDVMVLTRLFVGFDKHFTPKESVVFEEFLSGDFVTFVSEDGTPCQLGTGILEAFCHFTYHQSGGETVLSNLKGVLEDSVYTLTKPVIHSRRHLFGDRDKGMEGIRVFFRNHVCTSQCETFDKPGDDVLSNQKRPSAPPAYQVSKETVTKETECVALTDQMIVSADIHSTISPLKLPPAYEETIKRTSDIS